jgi:hypothetical protein
MFVVVIRYGIYFTSDKRFGLAGLDSGVCRQSVGISLNSSICTALSVASVKQAVDVGEGNRLWM